MPSKTSKKKPVVDLPSIPKELIDQLVSGTMPAPTSGLHRLVLRGNGTVSGGQWVEYNRRVFKIGSGETATSHTKNQNRV
jgi:hypothetical protein